MNNSTMQLAISGISIKQDSHDRFCLNDLHKASGGEARHKPSNWLALQQVQELIDYLSNDDTDISASKNYDAGIPASKISPVETVRGKGKLQGTFVVKELVYSYAMWISAKFQIAVIRAYDAMVNQKPYGLKDQPLTMTKEHCQAIRDAVAQLAYPNFKQESPKIYWRLHQHFGVNHYDQINDRDFDKVMEILGKDPRKMELVPVDELEKLRSKTALPAGHTMVKIGVLRDLESFKEKAFLPHEAAKRLKELGFTVTYDTDEKEPLKDYQLTYQEFIRLMNECNEAGYRFVKKSELYDVGLTILDMGI